MREALCTVPELRSVRDILSTLTTHPSQTPLGISTLRGQFADNAEWRDDPARPAVVVGTVDMIGSRLLFSGYGCGFKSRPLHAGFLGQETLLVHDEAHLEPAFQELILAIECEQQRCRELGRFRVMTLTATARNISGQFGLTSADQVHPVVCERMTAKKGIIFHPVEDEKNIVDEVCSCAHEHQTSGQAILVFLRKLEHVEKVADKLRKAHSSVQILTGTLRGLERDALARSDAVFARFMPAPGVAPLSGTVYLVCTSAGEVGVNISADHLVCDLTPFDSMAQRFGRVNRFGRGDARIDIVHHLNGTRDVPAEGSGAAESTPANTETDSTGPAENNGDGKTSMAAKELAPIDLACVRTLSLLERLPKRNNGYRDASPKALGQLPATDRLAAFTPSPVIQPVNDILFDAWALTSIRQKLPGRPPVADWLHGVAEWEPPQTIVAWREEAGILTRELMLDCTPEDMLEDYPLKPHELLKDRTSRVIANLEKVAARYPDQAAWVIGIDGEITVLSLCQLVKKDRQNKAEINLDGCTVLLPPRVGGLENGILNGDTAFDESVHYDVSDQWTDEYGETRRRRIWNDDEAPEGMRLIRTLDIRPGEDEEPDEGDQPSRPRFWHWYVRPRSADDDGSQTSFRSQELEPHLQSAERFARLLADKLGLGGPEADAVALAARWHDLGKRRAVWQRAIGNHGYPEQVLAKSSKRMHPIGLGGYRHELGSLLDLSRDPAFGRLPFDVQDLVLHLVAAHHGRARPHFSSDEAFDPEHPNEGAIKLATEVPRRFARLQRRYGRWGLAHLESILRAADALASQTHQTGEKPA